MQEEAVAYTKEEMEDMYAYAVSLQREGLSSLEVGSRLMTEKGMDHQLVTELLEHLPTAVDDPQSEAIRKQELLIGASSLLIGSLLTAFSYTSASPGGKFIFAYGAIFYGLYRIAGALFKPR